jgi:hypothetical protein
MIGKVHSESTMATVTSCPSCSEKLRLPESLLGQKVRCPQCSIVFEATDTTAATMPAQKGADVPMPMSLDEPNSAPPAAPSAPSRSKPFGAVEINLSLDDDDAPKASPAPPRQPEPPPPEPLPLPERSNSRSDRDGEDEGGDNLMRCPICRKHNSRGSRRCYNCGERLTDETRRGGEGRGRAYAYRDSQDNYEPPRRDTEPHRSGLVLAMGIISLAVIAFVPGLGVPFGLIGWILGSKDLRKMRNNVMDPDGEGVTRAGWICSIIGTLINGAFVLFCCGIFGFVYMIDQSNAPRTTRTYFVPNQPGKQFAPNPAPQPNQLNLGKDVPPKDD